MNKVVVFTVLGIFLLFGASLVAGRHVFDPWQRLLVEPPPGAPGAPDLAPGEMSWMTYKKVKLALGSFDLVNGLTKHELETIHTNRSLGFYYLLVCLWLVLGLGLVFGRHWGRRKSWRPGATDG